jgi:hypothetical protein
VYVTSQHDHCKIFFFGCLEFLLNYKTILGLMLQHSMVTLTFRYNPLQLSTAITIFDTFPAACPNILQLCNIPRRHGQNCQGSGRIVGRGYCVRITRGRGLRRPLPSRVLSISILLVELSMLYARRKGLEWGVTWYNDSIEFNSHVNMRGAKRDGELAF